MNFQAVEQVNDQKDKKNFPVKVDMLGVVTEIKGAGTSKSGTQYIKTKIRDMTGQEHPVSIYSPNQPPIGQSLSFSLSSYSGKFGVGFSGFWNAAANTNPTAPYVPPQQPLQNMPSDKFGAKNNHPQTATEKDWQIVRQCCIKAAAEYCGNAVSPDGVIGVAEQFAQYCILGNIEPTTRDDGDEEPPPTVDDIPF